MIGLDNTIPNVAQPSLQAKLDAPTPTLRWMVDSYALVFASLPLATPGWDTSADWRVLLLDELGCDGRVLPLHVAVEKPRASPLDRF